MGIAAVIITLVQCAISLVALGGAFWFAGIVLKQIKEIKILREHKRRCNAALTEQVARAVKAESQVSDLTAANKRLREQVSKIPLAPKPKPVDNATKHARTSGDVRRITEQAWGTKPDDRLN